MQFDKESVFSKYFTNPAVGEGQATVAYKNWDAAKHAANVAKHSDDLAKQGKKAVEAIVEHADDVPIKQIERIAKKPSLAKRVAKKIPVIGTAITLFFWREDVHAKGAVNGTINTGIDAIPFVGLGKGGVEIFTGDLIPDKKSEHPGPGRLECNRLAVGAWEKCKLVASGNKVAIAFHTGYLCAEGGGGRRFGQGAPEPAIANREAIGPWELWAMIRNADGTYAFVSNDGFYLTAEGGGGSGMSVDRREPGEWERFELEEQGDKSYAIKSVNGRYVSAQP